VVLDSIRGLVTSDPSAPAIVVRGLTETFRLSDGRPPTFKERLYRMRRTRWTKFNALKDVSFTVGHGETVGIIGHNGSGKSTLLKVLARILEPDRGIVEINGRVASLLELGAGFHSDLSGRENIALNAAILGLQRDEVTARFDDIVEFSGVRQFLDTAVRNYSSGMYVRLGFAIAVNVDPDILLVDEVLSVGDAQFQERSLKKMLEFKERGKTIVMVSHDLNAIETVCDRVLVLDHGTVVFDGSARQAVETYRQLVGTDSVAAVRELGQYGTGEARIVDVQLLDAGGRPVRRVWPSTPLTLRVRIVADHYIERCSIGAWVNTGDGRRLYETHTTWQGLAIGPLTPGQHAAADIRFTAHVLAGHYLIGAACTDTRARIEYALAPDVIRLEVQPAPGSIGMVDFAATTSVSEGPVQRTDTQQEGTGPIPVVEAGTEGRSEHLRAVENPDRVDGSGDGSGETTLVAGGPDAVAGA